MTRRSQSSSRWPGGSQGGLASDILPMADRVLKPGGAAPIKVFQGAGFQELVAPARRQFKSVRFIKPAASRARGAETGPVATGLRLV